MTNCTQCDTPTHPDDKLCDFHHNERAELDFNLVEIGQFGGYLLLNGNGDLHNDDSLAGRTSRAALMSAAPALLSALEDALEVMGEWGEDGDPEWAKQARAVIDKATGGSQ